jgi:hypothetical protein
LPLAARPQEERPCGGRARRGAGRVPYGQGPRGSGFGSTFSSGPQFPSCGDLYPPMGPGMFGGFPNTYHGQMSQHWFPYQYPNPSDVPFAHPVSYY